MSLRVLPSSVLALKDGEIVAERQGYGRRPDMRMLSNSNASGAHLAQERDALWRGVVAQYGAW